jgi:hypothetical protein
MNYLNSSSVPLTNKNIRDTKSQANNSLSLLNNSTKLSPNLSRPHLTVGESPYTVTTFNNLLSIYQS